LNSELIISTSEDEVRIALLEDKNLVELNHEKKDKSYSVGDIYLGRVKKVIPGLNAAFVDIGYEKDAFLHYLDLGPQVQSLLKLVKQATMQKNADPLFSNFTNEPDIDKGGRITNVLNNNQWVVVQVAKEPISTKGPRITSELSIAGRYVVLVPFSETVSVSQKIKSSEERTRLKRLVQSIKPKNFGVIIRTVAEGKKVAELDSDLKNLVGKWKGAIEKLKTSSPPQKLMGEMDRTSTILRDLLNPNFNAIHVNDSVMHEEVKQYLRSISPEQEQIAKLYKGKVPIFEHFGVDKQIKSLFGKTVNMPNGAYLIIEHTEALHVIDINSGVRFQQSESSQEENALQVNLEAAGEVARHLRLRDMGGIIVIDFIDMRSAQNRKKLFDKLREEMKRDRAKHTILPPSRFGLVQLTRQRVRPETKIVTAEKCPSCDGTGEIKASILVLDEIENNLRFLAKEQNEKKLTLNTHPFIEAFINRGWLSSLRKKWQKKHKVILKVTPSTNYHFLEYHFFNDKGEEIKI
jgi:ribonuclease G